MAIKACCRWKEYDTLPETANLFRSSPVNPSADLKFESSCLLKCTVSPLQSPDHSNAPVSVLLAGGICPPRPPGCCGQLTLSQWGCFTGSTMTVSAKYVKKESQIYRQLSLVKEYKHFPLALTDFIKPAFHHISEFLYVSCFAIADTAPVWPGTLYSHASGDVTHLQGSTGAPQGSAFEES